MRLIDAEALIEEIDKANDKWTIPHNIVVETIFNASTVEAKPVVHAHWRGSKFAESMGIYGVVGCSNCDKNGSKYYRYCPYCGAQMDEVAEYD